MAQKARFTPRHRAVRRAPAARAERDVLEAAVTRVEARWGEVAADALDRHEARVVLDGLVAEIRRRSGGGRSPTPPAGADTPLGRRLLQLLRAEVISTWLAGPVPAPEAMLALLGAIETTAEAIEADWARHFADRLAGPGGLELLVEVAHDLRSPLTSVLFLAETLQRGQSGAVNELQHRQLGLIYSAALGLSSLASDAIELARLSDQLADRVPAPFSVAETLESVCHIVHPMAEEKGLTVRLLPPEGDRRRGHAAALSRVLLNLTSNAIKFTEQGFVEITARPQGRERLEFAVRDTGPGISQDVLATLFEPFRRSRGRPGYTFSGTCLGLAICRKLVAAMGAELKLESRPGWGTRFYFELDLPLVSSM